MAQKSKTTKKTHEEIQRKMERGSYKRNILFLKNMF